MQANVLKCKIHTATVTEANVEYEGSITVCHKLMKAAGLWKNEQVDVNNATNGNRITTYVIPGEEGQICLNGAAAKLFSKGDVVHILSYCSMDTSLIPMHEAKVIHTKDNKAI